MYILCSVDKYRYLEIQSFDDYCRALKGYYHIMKMYPDENFVILKKM